MIGSYRIAVVVPAYEVEREIGVVLNRMPTQVDFVFVVDDCSPDRTAAIVDGLQRPGVTVLTHSRNQGVGGATVTGMMAAIRAGADIIVKCDGDAQMDPQDIPFLVAPLTARVADHAKGSRFHHVRELRTMPRVRFAGNIALTFLTKLASGYWNVLDPVNGFFATRVEVLKRIPLQTLSKRYFFESDLLIRLNIVNARVADVPLPARYSDERSSLSLSRAVIDFPPRLLFGLVRRVFWKYLFYDVSPVAIFGLAGSVLAAFGGGFGTYEWVLHYLQGKTTPLGTIMVAVLPLIFGFQLLLQAIVLDIQNTPRPTSFDVSHIQNYPTSDIDMNDGPAGD